MSEEQRQERADNEPMSRVSLRATPLPAKAASRVLLVPWGEVHSANGDFVVDAESARRVVEAFEAQGNDLPIDYEHQTLGGTYTSPTGQAPAAGWIKRLEEVEGEGIVAHVEWTQPAEVQLAERQYRYLSPVVLVRKSDRRVVALHSAALTNKPAIARLQPIVNRDGEDSHEGPAAHRAGPAAKENPMQAVFETLRDRLGLDAQTDEQAVLVAASERLADLEKRIALREAEEAVALAMKAGKLTSAQRAWAIELALRDPAAFAAWLETAPVVVPHGQLSPPDADPPGEARRASAEAEARREYRAHAMLQAVTSEEAYVRNAAREAAIQ